MDRRALEDAGFSTDQIEALIESFAAKHHEHFIEDIDGLNEALEDMDVCDEDDD